MKTNTSRTTLAKAAPTQDQAAKVELAKATSAKIEPPKLDPPRTAPASGPSTKPSPVRSDVSKARLELIKPEAKSVFVAGSFNGWKPAPLTRASDGKWIGDLTGITGRHEYLFVVDGQWLPDPNAKESVQNPYGGRNSVLVVSA